MYNSPLRYPGGKNKLAAFIAQICVDNNVNGHYVEPYAGGASVALFLLLEGYVNKISINDKDRSIYAFWYSVLNNSTELCELIRTADLTIENWLVQKSIQKNKHEAELLELGFSTLFLNRTNRSGIINGGVMGGVLQNGEFKIDCRFNKNDIINRILAISEKKDSINLFNLDAIDLIDLIENDIENDSQNTIFYFDPPYVAKGSSLYMNHYKLDNHLVVSERIVLINNIKWIVSYDNQQYIKSLYSDCTQKEYSFNHTAHHSKKGEEILIFCSNLIQPQQNDYNPIWFKQKKINQIKKIVYQPKRLKVSESV
jgi:Site-specific DNA methylase